MARTLQSFILCLVGNILCKMLLGCFFSIRRKNHLYNLFLIVIFSLITSFVAMAFGNTPIFKIAGNIILCSLLFYSIYNTNIINSFIGTMAYFALVLCIELPFYIIFPYILGAERIELISNNYMLSTITGLSVEFFDLIAVILISRFFGRKGYLKYLNLKDWLTFLCLPLFSVIVLIALVLYDIQYFSVIISIALLLFNVILYNYLQENGLQNKRKMELLAIEERNRAQLQSFNDIKNLYEEQRIRIHEFKNQINLIKGLIDTHDYSTLQSYITELKTSIDSKTISIETGNPVINILINQAVKKASLEDISIIPDICINSGIRLTDNDLVIIISNLLNNAIEHCETLHSSSKLIKFKLENTDNHLLITCINPIEKPILVENNLIVTTKDNKAEHGYGLKNIIQTVEKYKGDISISTDDNKFKYVILIEYD